MSHRSSVTPASMASFATAFSYSPGHRVGDLLFASGQIGRDQDGHIPTDLEEQFSLAFENVALVLAEAGLGFEHVVDLTTYHTSMDDLHIFAGIKDRYITHEPLPAWTGVGVAELADPKVRVEIRVIADMSRESGSQSCT